MIETTRGQVPESMLERTVGVEDRPRNFVIWVEYRLGTELVRRDAFELPEKTHGEVIETVLGMVPARLLQRVVQIRENEEQFQIDVVFFNNNAQLVRNDVHILKKRASSTIGAVAGSF